MAEWYSSVFDDYFLEIMRHENVDNLDLINQNIIKLSNNASDPKRLKDSGLIRKIRKKHVLYHVR